MTKGGLARVVLVLLISSPGLFTGAEHDLRDHTALVTPDGRLWGWGANTFGQAGGEPSAPRVLPGVAVPSGIRAVATGRGFTVALATDGSVWAWGFNGSGQLGDGSFTSRADFPFFP